MLQCDTFLKTIWGLTVCLLEKKFFEICWAEWFYMTKQLHNETPLASLERHQMYKDDLFLDCNCVIILPAPRRLCRVELISLWQSRCCSTSV